MCIHTLRRRVIQTTLNNLECDAKHGVHLNSDCKVSSKFARNLFVTAEITFQFGAGGLTYRDLMRSISASFIHYLLRITVFKSFTKTRQCNITRLRYTVGMSHPQSQD